MLWNFLGGRRWLSPPDLVILLGHELLVTTAGYARLAPERLRSVFEKTHPDKRASEVRHDTALANWMESAAGPALAGVSSRYHERRGEPCHCLLEARPRILVQNGRGLWVPPRPSNVQSHADWHSGQRYLRFGSFGIAARMSPWLSQWRETK